MASIDIRCMLLHWQAAADLSWVLARRRDQSTASTMLRHAGRNMGLLQTASRTCPRPAWCLPATAHLSFRGVAGQPSVQQSPANVSPQVGQPAGDGGGAAALPAEIAELPKIRALAQGLEAELRQLRKEVY